MNRRKLVRTAMAAGVLTGAAPFAVAELPRTPRDYTGPFYPRGPRNRTNDLIAGKPRTDVLSLAGRGVDARRLAARRRRGGYLAGRPQRPLQAPTRPWPRRAARRVPLLGRVNHRRGRRVHLPHLCPRQLPSAPPPQHIHYKVWTEDREPLLTSQIYFAQLGGAGRYARSDGTTELQTTDLLRETDTVLRATIDIVI